MEPMIPTTAADACPRCGAPVAYGFTSCKEMFEAVLVRDYSQAAYAAEHRAVVRRWAEAVWQAWSPHHPWAREAAAKAMSAG